MTLYDINEGFIVDKQSAMQNNKNERSISKVSERHFAGKDEQADNKAILLPPGHWTEFDPFLLMAEDWFSSNGFDWHPHRGIETITVVLEGELEHHDNRGGHGILKAGDVQWMTAGRGLLHREMAYNKKPVHTLQLWINLPADKKMIEPRYQDLRGDQVPIRIEEENGLKVRVFSGKSARVKGPEAVANHVPITMLDVIMNKEGARFTQEIPVDQEGFVLVLSGQGKFGKDKTSIKAGQIGHLSKTSKNGGPTNLTVIADEKSPSSLLRFLLWTGEPLHQTVVAYGPFVMNTKEQIDEAFTDYKNGLFGSIPNSSRL
jgi:redox-sensitive bicupin YhaK (pirin superfamily)